jgi:uncharacterized protein YggE
MTTESIVVTGNAVVPGEPDEARLEVRLTALRNTPAEALAEVAKDSQELQGIFSELSIGSNRRTSTGISVNAESEYDGRLKRSIHRGYRASSGTTLRLDDAELVGKLVGAVTRRTGGDVQGPRWQIALENPARVDACRAASADARRKAEAYATALGARVGVVLSVTEPGVGGRSFDTYDMQVSAAMAAPPPDLDIEVDVGSLDVRASVEVTFSIEQDR